MVAMRLIRAVVIMKNQKIYALAFLQGLFFPLKTFFYKKSNIFRFTPQFIFLQCFWLTKTDFNSAKPTDHHQRMSSTVPHTLPQLSQQCIVIVKRFSCPSVLLRKKRKQSASKKNACVHTSMYADKHFISAYYDGHSVLLE